MEDFKKIVHQGVKQKVKALIEPMLLNKVKPNKISKILDDYVIQGKLTQDDLPQIAYLRKTMTKKTNVVQTEGESRKILEEFNIDNVQNSHEAFIIGHELDPENFVLVFTSMCLLQNVLSQDHSFK